MTAGAVLDLGGMRVDAIVEFDALPVPRAMLFPDLDDAAAAVDAGWMAPDFLDPATDCFLLRHQGWLVRTPRLTMVVDCAAGDAGTAAAAPRGRSDWCSNLAALGVDPQAVDIVVNTHLHAGHVGWNTRSTADGRVPTFAKADYLIGRNELEYWFTEDLRGPAPQRRLLDDHVLPVLDAGLGRFVDQSHEITEGVILEPAYGHTPGHMIVRLTGGDGEAVIAADVMHQPLQVRRPDLSSGFCVDRTVAAATRRAFLRRFCDTPTVILPTHFRRGTAGLIVAAEDGYDYRFGIPENLKATDRAR